MGPTHLDFEFKNVESKSYIQTKYSIKKKKKEYTES